MPAQLTTSLDHLRRRHEMAIRIALGARTTDVVRLGVAQAFSFAGAGVTLGLFAVLLLARWAQPLLFQESAFDPSVLAAVGATIAVVALLASAAPAARAARTDPNLALRAE
jgi:ABC-type antimicrobial peptide transport system permease subunit